MAVYTLSLLCVAVYILVYVAVYTLVTWSCTLWCFTATRYRFAANIHRWSLQSYQHSGLLRIVTKSVAAEDTDTPATLCGRRCDDHVITAKDMNTQHGRLHLSDLFRNLSTPKQCAEHSQQLGMCNESLGWGSYCQVYDLAQCINVTNYIFQMHHMQIVRRRMNNFQTPRLKLPKYWFVRKYVPGKNLK